VSSDSRCGCGSGSGGWQSPKFKFKIIKTFSRASRGTDDNEEKKLPLASFSLYIFTTQHIITAAVAATPLP